jgi:general secretion pathway protein A
MYQRHYGFRDLPFELTSDPRYLFFTARHREALVNLEYGLSTAKAVTVLIGEAGTGKTTLLRAALDSDRCRKVQCVYVHNPALRRMEFIEMLSRQLGLSARASQSKSIFLEELEQMLRERREAGRIVALVVDEAQSLSYDLLEEIRLLANIETPTDKLLPLVLAGQPEFASRLNEPELRQFKQRIALRCELLPLTVSETAAYIASRIGVAGGDAGRLFTREAVVLIHEYSRGIPRTISVICDNALVAGLALDRHRVDREIVLEVCRDFDFEPVQKRAPADELLSAPAAAPPQPSSELISARPAAEKPTEEEPVAQRTHVAGKRLSLLGLSRG